uniref:Envelope protein n=1 Tax=Steinernema glaseri TaxID=37863 RepID=A0A1I7ZCM7_9BILA
MSLDSLLNSSSSLLDSVAVLSASLTLALVIAFCLFVGTFLLCGLLCIVCSVRISIKSWRELKAVEVSRNNSTYIKAETVDEIKLPSFWIYSTEAYSIETVLR